MAKGAPRGNKFALGNKGGKPYSGDVRKQAATLKGLVIVWATKVMRGKDETKKVFVVGKILPACIPQDLNLGGQEYNPVVIDLPSDIKTKLDKFLTTIKK